MRRLPSMHRLEGTVMHSEDLIAWLCREQPWTLLLAVAATGAAWACTMTEFWLVTRALELLLTPAQAIGTLVLVYFAFTTPMPGGLGAVEAAILLAFTTFGFTPSQAVSVALYIRFRDLTEAAIGLLLGGVSWNKLHSIEAVAVETDAAALPPPPVTMRAAAAALYEVDAADTADTEGPEPTKAPVDGETAEAAVALPEQRP